ncbi:aspartate--tRNA ligase [Candidatus Nitrososphaera gargensis Ga9.2]|uniref:Aspartate--tRNA(Asp) ligase n=1 Tax=Nitrososphaera gargensis (strain Ga9.2) TaxID=1237085 RepID=K0IG97_NITGG|nr:aspartate--tRNA(Asn) ligase [Candidatus Nitrososphaera gargensis]AFU58820.1 aspartate--tRNA ligase [Candidatus Nitrososphaera gargensis Ga9.2]
MVNIKRTHYARQLDDQLVGQQVRVGGWIEDVRDIGKLAFVTIRDVTGACQVIVTGDSVQAAVQAPRQSAVVVAGVVQKSKAKDFPVEVKVSEFTVLTKAVHPLPIDPTGRVESAIDKRLDARALDLRTPKVAAIFRLRSAGLVVVRDTLLGEGFIEVNTPKVIGSASEGGANLFSFDYFGKRKAYLAQSPQLYKEQLTLGLDRVFEIGPYFRAENSHTVRHLTEFISVDIEAAFLDYEDVMDIVERVVRNVATAFQEKHKADLQLAGGKDISVSKIDRLTYEQCLDELAKEGEKLQFGDDLSDAALRKLGEIHRGFYFITDWPLKLKPFYIHEKEDNPKLSKSFDLQYGYLELVSGGRRLHDPAKLRSRLAEQGLNPASFEEHLKAFDWGMPPHSGWGLGYDRLMMVLTGSQNVRDVVLYPRDTDRLTP